MMDLVTPQHFINGKFVNASTKETIKVINPSTEEVILETPRGTALDVEKAVVAAKEAHAKWRLTTPSYRSSLLFKVAQKMEDDIENLISLESENVGKPRQNAFNEISFAIDLIRFCAGAGRCLEGKAAGEYIENHTSMIRRDSLGVVAGITPWNYPVVMLAYKFGPALATGNTLILKPSEQTPLTTLRIAELTKEILPAGVFNVITGDEVAGSAIVKNKDIRFVSLTGSTDTGKIIAREASNDLKRVTLELGGKAPVIVLDDADINAVVEGMRKGAFYNTGQDCTAATRIIATKGIYDKLSVALTDMAKEVVVGAPNEGDQIEIGPLVSKEQFDRVCSFFTKKETTAKILVGGKPIDRSGFFFEPTVIGNVEQDDDFIQKEVFGPVLTIQKVNDEKEAISLANGTDYGLGASVWTRDYAKAMVLTRDLEVGAVWVNCHDRVTPEMPHGGLKMSGYGKDLSMYSLEEYTHVKHIMFNNN